MRKPKIFGGLAKKHFLKKSELQIGRFIPQIRGETIEIAEITKMEVANTISLIPQTSKMGITCHMADTGLNLQQIDISKGRSNGGKCRKLGGLAILNNKFLCFLTTFLHTPVIHLTETTDKKDLQNNSRTHTKKSNLL